MSRLSNTATPKYYNEFRNAVIRGEIPVCHKVSMAMNLIDELIAEPAFYYDPDPVEGFINFCNAEMTLTDGSDMHVLDSFKLWAEDILGWYYFVERSVYVPSRRGPGHYETKYVKKRLRNKQYLIVGRGGIKSMYDACIQAYFVTVDTTTTDQIVVAPTLRQADETMSPIRTAITRARGPLFQFLTEGSINNTTGTRRNRQKLCSTKKGIENFLTNSIIETRPMSIAKLQGLRPKVSTVDEWLSCDIVEDVVDALAQGARKIDDWLIVCTSSEGTVRNGIGDTIKMELDKILKGEFRDPHTSIWWYMLDDVKEVAHPELWPKANPNIGITVSYDDLMDEVEKAEASPAARNDTLAKRFGIPTEGFTYFFTYEETIKHKPRSFWKCNCALGIDLSRGDDFCAFTFLFPLRGGRYGIKARSYITERTLMRLSPAMRQKYDEFLAEGTLCVMHGSVLDMMEVYDDLEKFIENNSYVVCCVGYDPYGAKEFINRWEVENGSFAIEKVVQGAKTESIPLGEIKDLAEDRLLFFDEDIMTFCLGNCVVLEDTNGNRKLYKRRADEKIDNIAALLDAYVAYKVNKDNF